MNLQVLLKSTLHISYQLINELYRLLDFLSLIKVKCLEVLKIHMDETKQKRYSTYSPFIKALIFTALNNYEESIFPPRVLFFTRQLLRW